jgi:quinol monooxygenase YgiN
MMDDTMAQKIDVVAHIHAAPGQEAPVREVLEGFVEPTRREQGCLRYDLFEDMDHPGQFTFIEEWASREDLSRHAQSSHITAGRACLEGKEAQPAWVQVVRRIL